MTRVRASDVPRSSKSWRRRERYRRRVRLQAQFRSLEIKRLIWTLTPCDDVAGEPGQGVMVASETKTSAASETSSFDLSGCVKESTSCSGESSVGAPAVSYAAPVPVVEYTAPALQVSQVAPETMYTGWRDPPDAALPCYTSPKLSETANLKMTRRRNWQLRFGGQWYGSHLFRENEFRRQDDVHWK